jgi:hypothetical protein
VTADSAAIRTPRRNGCFAGSSRSGSAAAPQAEHVSSNTLIRAPHSQSAWNVEPHFTHCGAVLGCFLAHA